MTAVSDPIIQSPETVIKPSTRALAVNGAMWTVLGYGGGQFLRLLSNLVLTRLLLPKVFGIMTIVQIFIQGLQMFSDIGAGPSVITSQREDPDFINTVWTMQLIRGAMLWVASVAIAWPVAWFYNMPSLRWLIPVAGLGALIGGTSSISLFSLNKKLALKSLTILALATQIASLIVMVGFAWWTHSIWALVIGGLFGTCVNAAASHFLLPGVRHRICWDRRTLDEVVHFGKWVFVSTIFAFIAGQLDRMILGKLVSEDILGVYAIALTLSTMPKNIIMRLASAVIFPIYARHASVERKEYAKKVLAARRILLPIGVVVVAGLATGSPAFFHWLYDSRYASAGWMGQLLAIYIWFWMLQSSVDRALLALGDSRSLTLSNFVNVLFTIVGCLAGFYLWSMPGFIVGLAVSSLAGHVVIEIMLYLRGINIFYQDMWYTLLTAGIVAVGLLLGKSVAAMVSPASRQVFELLVPNVPVLVTAGVAGWLTWRWLKTRPAGI